MLPTRWDTQNLIISHRLNEQWADADRLRLGARLSAARKRLAETHVIPRQPRLRPHMPHAHAA